MRLMQQEFWENRPLVTDAPVEFEKYPLEAQDFRKTID
jgi:hypothetical protein